MLINTYTFIAKLLILAVGVWCSRELATLFTSMGLGVLQTAAVVPEVEGRPLHDRQ